jgi:hypothetical protein
LQNVRVSAIYTDDRYRRFLDTILSVATTPQHPLNSKFLFSHLSRKKMPIRDAEWLPYLHYAYDEGTVVTRIIDWAWNIDFARVSKESLQLYAETICWLLASSNRFVRDRATKALVLVLSSCPDLALKLTRKFKGIDDDYIIERIIIASYGSFTRNRNKRYLFRYANFAYEYYFTERNLPANISIRFYARRILILAKELGWTKVLRKKILNPPFKSEWPKNISTMEELEGKYKLVSWDSMNPQWGYNAIHSSVLGWGDFARYEIGTDHESPWVPKDYLPVARKKISFKRSLTSKQKKLFDILVKALERSFFTNKNREELIIKTELSLLKGLSAASKMQWLNEIKPFLKYGTEKPNRLPYSTIQCMIMDRIESMGYSTELHGSFDRYLSYGDAGRSADKPERIGKKYQWISFFNVIGMVSDRYNHLSYGGLTADPDLEEMRFIKHIDPTIALRSYADLPNLAKSKSIDFPSVTEWSPEKDNFGWIKSELDFIQAEELVYQTGTDGSEWVLLDGGHSFQEETPPEEEKFSLQRRDVFYVINSCIYEKEHERKILKFLENVDYAGRWMPESRDQIDPHFAEFAFEIFRTEMPSAKICSQSHGGVPFRYSLTTEQYIYEKGTHDCSMDETLHLMMPSLPILNSMGLEGKNFDGTFSLNDNPIAFNIRDKTAHGFLFEKNALEEFLQKNNLGIFWSILAEKRMIGGTPHRSPGRHDLSSSLVYVDGKLKEVGRKLTLHRYEKD